MNDVALAGPAPPSRIERLTAALAPATRDSYCNGWHKWDAFARAHGATTLPAPPEALAAFVESVDKLLISLARTGARALTIRAAVKRPVRDSRDAGGTVRQSTGITAAAVARIEATAYRPRPRGRGMESPTTAKARAELEIAIIRTMRDTLARVAAPTAPLFGLSASRIKARITAAAEAAGLEGVSSHGCRIGMAQDLARAKGIEMPAIMQAGGGRSETTVARYTARETAARGAVVRFYEQEGTGQ